MIATIAVCISSADIICCYGYMHLAKLPKVMSHRRVTMDFYSVGFPDLSHSREPHYVNHLLCHMVAA